MALPKLNTPTHELELPSTGEKIKFRPFLVKEQKLLILAQESKDETQLVDTMTQLIDSCTFGKVDAATSPIFDVEYIFLKLRSKSVGETVNVSVICQDDEETKAKVKINLEEVSVHMTADHTNEVKVNEQTKLVMKYPRLKDMNKVPENADDYSQMFLLLTNRIHESRLDDKNYKSVDTTVKELDEFVDSMDTTQLETVLQFFTTMPKLRHPIKFINPKTKVKNEVVLEGLQSFLV